MPDSSPAGERDATCTSFSGPGAGTQWQGDSLCIPWFWMLWVLLEGLSFVGDQSCNHLQWKRPLKSLSPTRTQHCHVHLSVPFPDTTSTHLLNASRDGDSTAAQGSLLQCLITLQWRPFSQYLIWTSSSATWGHFLSDQATSSSD